MLHGARHTSPNPITRRIVSNRCGASEYGAWAARLGRMATSPRSTRSSWGPSSGGLAVGPAEAGPHTDSEAGPHRDPDDPPPYATIRPPSIVIHPSRTGGPSIGSTHAARYRITAW